MWEEERMCAFCGGRVAKNSKSNYCKNHGRLFGKFDREVEQHIGRDDWPTHDVPVYREPDPAG